MKKLYIPFIMLFGFLTFIPQIALGDMPDIFNLESRLKSFEYKFNTLQKSLSGLNREYNEIIYFNKTYNRPNSVNPNYFINLFLEDYSKTITEYLYFKELSNKTDEELIEIFSSKYLTDSNKTPTMLSEDTEMIEKLKGILNKPYYDRNFVNQKQALEVILKEEGKEANQVVNLYHGMFIQNKYGRVSHPCWVVTDKNDMEIIKEALDYFKLRLEEIYDLVKLTKTKQNQFIRRTVTPQKVMEYAYAHMRPSERVAINLVVSTTKPDITLRQMIKFMRKYLINFHIKTNINIFNRFFPKVLSKKLIKMLPEERETFIISHLTEIKPGSKKFLSDLRRSDMLIAGKNISKISPLLIIGAVLTVGTITEVSANNNFNNVYTVSVRDLGKIKTKIENGNASLQEQWFFYTDERNEDLIEKDPVHTLKFVELVKDVIEAEELLLEAEKEYKEQQNKVIEKTIENSILKNYLKQESKTDFGVGTL